MINELLFLIYIVGIPLLLVIATWLFFERRVKTVRFYALTFLRSLPLQALYIVALYCIEVYSPIRIVGWATPTLTIILPVVTVLAGIVYLVCRPSRRSRYHTKP